MVAWVLRLGLFTVIGLAGVGQAESADAPRSPAAEVGRENEGPQATQVSADHLDVFDRPDERSFGTGRLERGDRVRVRGWVAGGWAAIDPPATTIGWIERTSLDLGDAAREHVGHRLEPGESGSVPPSRARVVVPRAVVRSGHLEARLPGPPWVELTRGTMVHLVDRPPVTTGRGAGAMLWFAVVPSAEAACYVRAEGLRDARRREGVPEMLAAYLVPDGDEPRGTGSVPEALPPGVAAEIGRVDAMHRALLTQQPIDRWRFDAIRADYQAILKRSGDNPAVEEALRVRLTRVTRHEQAAAAAREFQEVLALSRRRDDQIARLQDRLAAVDRYRTRTYQAVGVVQPSSRLVDGRKVHVLIDPEGKTIAYLDIPPGLDLESLGARRVGVRGAVHYNPDLGTRLITVRDLEPVGTRR
jgi:hypothetical protein